MTKRFTKAISLFLVLVMLLQISGIAEFVVFATDSTPETTVSEPAEIVGELVTERDEFTKRYRLDDGTTLAAVYPEAIHYNEDDEWVEIDNTLKSTTDTYEIPTEVATVTGTYTTQGLTLFEAADTVSAAESGGDLAESDVVADSAPETVQDIDEAETANIAADSNVELTPIVPVAPGVEEITTPMWGNTANSFGVMLPATLNEDSRIHVSHLGYDMYFGVVLNDASGTGNIATAATDIASATATISSFESEATDERMQTMEITTSSGLVYADVQPGVNIEYILSGQKLKETIVIDDLASVPSKIGYTIRAEGLVPVVNADNSIDFLAEHDVIFSLPSPYMFDSNQDTSYDIDVSLMALNTGEFLLIYTPSESWLEDESRAWPVSIDPIITGDNSHANVIDTYVYSTMSSSGTTPYKESNLYSGYHTSSGKFRSYIRFAELPEFESADVILKASLYLYGQGVTDTKTVRVSAHAITQSWASSSVYWSSNLQYEDEALDYQIMNDDNEFAQFEWDITAAAKRWYADNIDGMDHLTNYGVALISDTENATSNHVCAFAAVDSNKYLYPALVFQYTTSSGLENYWDYTSQNMGRAGTVYVNNFTGNLVVRRTDMSYSGNRMPAAITFNYNFTDREQNSGYGNGWSMDYAQIFYVEESALGTHWRLVDGDGTSKDFYIDENEVWHDEAGQGYELVLDYSTTTERFVVTDKDDNTMYFDNQGRLLKIIDGQAANQSNAISITYVEENSENLRVSTVIDGAGRKYAFTYDETTDNLSKLVYYGTGTAPIETVTYTYDSSGCLTKVKYEDGKSTTYTWNGKMMATASDIARDSVAISYYTAEGTSNLPVRVESVSLLSNSTLVTSASFDYGQNYTKVTDNVGRWCIYQFNNYGNTTSVYNDQGQALYGRYAKDDDSSARSNQLVSSSRLQDTVTNLLPNPSFESTSSWTTGGTFSTTAKRTGAKSLKLAAAEQSATAEITVTAGKTYTLSGFVKTESGGTARLSMTAGNTSVTGETVSGTDWTQSEVTLTVPSGVTKMTISATQMSAGVVYLDDFQFENTEAASRYNLVTDSNMTNNSSLWKYTNCDSSDGFTTLSGDHGGLDHHVLALTEDCYTKKSAYQEISIPDGASGDVFTFGTWVKTGSAPLTNTRWPEDTESRSAGIKLDVYSGSTLVTSETVMVNASCREWQFISGSVDVGQSYDKVVVRLLHEYNINESYYDGVQVFRERFGYHYEYDEDGNVTKIVGLDGEETVYNYVEGTSDVSSIELPSGATYSYSYNSNHQLLGTTSATGVTTTHGYDSYGNCTTTTISYTGNTGPVIKSDVTYTSDGNMMASTTGGDRETITYTNDTERSLVTAITDAAGNTTSSTYDSMRRQLTSTIGNATLSYEYVNDAISSISHTTSDEKVTSYYFTYGTSGLTESVKVGSGDGAYTMAQNSYNNGTWTLASQTYGNGTTWNYTYTEFDDLESRFTETENGAGVEFRYFYNNEGNLARVETNDVVIADGAISSRTFVCAERYYYDTEDRLTRLVEVDADGDIVHEYSWKYNQNDEVTQLVEKIGTVTYNYSYDYNDDEMPTEVTYGSTTETITYDSYGRMGNVKVSNGTVESLLSTQYAYRNVVDSGTTYATAQVQTATSTFGSNSLAYSYTYDDNGNILTISDGIYTTSYVYDELNQLVWEYNQAAGKAWKYDYDHGGNILAKTEYTYSNVNGSWEATNGTAVAYTYGDAQWGDLLTAYNGSAITYDGAGNMRNLGNWQFEWTAGKQLASATDGSSTLSFAYNDCGLRTSKSFGNITHNYTYCGATISSDVTAADAMYFHYNQNDEIIGFTYVASGNTSEYYYLKNIQGDVLGILDSNGALVAEYTYDAWGRILDVSGSNTELANRNPIRYRGYYYDIETALYCLQTRYYAPTLCRFISADDYLQSYENVVGSNMYAYCCNNPVDAMDAEGTSVLGAVIVGCVIGGVIGAVFGAFCAAATGGNVAVGAVTGFAAGAVSAIPNPAWATAWVTIGLCVYKAAFSAMANYWGQMATKKLDDVNWTSVFSAGVVSFGSSVATLPVPVDYVDDIMSNGTTYLTNSVVSANSSGLDCVGQIAAEGAGRSTTRGKTYSAESSVKQYSLAQKEKFKEKRSAKKNTFRIDRLR